MKRSVATVLLVLALAGCADAARDGGGETVAVARTPRSAPICDRYAAAFGTAGNPGTAARPLRTPQQLARRLAPGETGCLRGGSYASSGLYVLRVDRGGRPGRRIVIRSFPGETARLQGVVYVPRGSDHVTLSHLAIDGSAPGQITVQLTARDTRLDHLDITNDHTKTCVIVGDTHGYGRAYGTVIRDSVLHECGSFDRGLLDHAIYVSNARRTRIVGNVLTGAAGYGVQLYPDADGSVVSQNVIADNGGGVIFAGEGDLVSSDNLVERNVITGSTRERNVAVYWPGRPGRGNVARDNCLSDARDGDIEPQSALGLSGNRSAAPGFVNARLGDFRLSPGSACRGVVGGAAAEAASAYASR